MNKGIVITIAALCASTILGVVSYKEEAKARRQMYEVGKIVGLTEAISETLKHRSKENEEES